mgnify:CR=1 FL=1
MRKSFSIARRYRSGPAALVLVFGLATVATEATANFETETLSEVVRCDGRLYQGAKAQEGRKGVTWTQAKNLAHQFDHRGRRGHLAVVDTLARHACIRDHILPKLKEEAWIGLRYWCNFQRLEWVNRKFKSTGTPGPWESKWSRYNTCNARFMGVYYTKETDRWQAVELNKRMRYLIVEYPMNVNDGNANERARIGPGS